MIDCGPDWLNLLSRVSRSVILLTHAHSDQVPVLLAAPLSGLRFRNPQRLLGRYPGQRGRIGPALRSIGWPTPCSDEVAPLPNYRDRCDAWL